MKEELNKNNDLSLPKNSNNKFSFPSNLIVNTQEGINKITSIQFGVLSSSDISKLSTIECVNRDLYDENKIPIPYGPIDFKLGVNQKNIICPKKKKKNRKLFRSFWFYSFKFTYFSHWIF